MIRTIGRTRKYSLLVEMSDSEGKMMKTLIAFVLPGV
jgi:hypothetical protein